MTARDDGIRDLALPDMERRIANMVRDGVIVAVDLSAKRVRVQSGEITTAWLPWPAGRAGAGKRRWDPPEVGEQVTMISASGDLRQARVIPGLYQDAYDAPSADGNLDLTEYGDGTRISYDRGSHTLMADLGDSTIKADRSEISLMVGSIGIRITSAGLQLIGNISWAAAGGGAATGTMNGSMAFSGDSLTHNGKNIGGDHAHSGVQTGSGNSGGPV